MKIILNKSWVFIFCAILVFSSCNKKEEPLANSGINPPPLLPPSQPISGMLIGNKELFWEQPWDTAAGGYIMKLKTWRLTQDKINSGIDVGIAIFGAGDSPWVTTPTSLYDLFLQDSVHVSYNATPGQLQLKARTSFDFTKVKSDVYIEYN